MLSDLSTTQNLESSQMPPSTIAGDPESAADFDSGYNLTTDMSRMTDTDTIAPARDVARRKEEYNRIKEEKEKAKQEAIEKRARNLELGIDDENTNLPLELLIK